MSLCKNYNKPDCTFGFKSQCEICDQAGCTWGTFSETLENTKHRLRFGCAGFGCTFGDFVSEFDDEEIQESGESDSWWSFPSSPKSIIPLVKNYCNCFLQLAEMKVNKDRCLLHGTLSDANEEEIDSDDGSYYCW